jgi:hypothetical protein
MYYMLCNSIQGHATKIPETETREIELRERLSVNVKSVMVVRRYEVVQSEIESGSVKIVILCYDVW